MSTPALTARASAGTQRLIAVAGGLIVVSTMLSLIGRPSAMAFVGGLLLTLLIGHVAYDRYLLEQFGTRGDITRAIISACALASVAHVAHWPLAMWMLVPFVAVVTDPQVSRVGNWSIIGIIAAQDVFAIYDRVPLAYPIGFTLLAISCALVVRERSAIIQRMLADEAAQHAELSRAHRRLQSAVDARDRTELELRQSQRLEAVGRLAAGVAHEVNTPVQFVSDSLRFVKSAIEDTTPIIRKYQALRKAVAKVAALRPLITAIADAEESADLEYILGNVPKSVERSLDGLKRIATIVKALKEFAQPEATGLVPMDVNRAIEGTLTIATQEYTRVADIDLSLATVPSVTCQASDINQVLLTIIVNAANAIEDVVKERGGRGMISIATAPHVEHQLEGVLITITDTGGGIPESVRERIFDPFFTTKEFGRGTGQDLAIARTVVEKHGGKLWFASEVGVGTTFYLRLPIVPPPVDETGAYCVVPTERAA